MSGFTAIDLSRLPPPAAVETLDFEAILAARKADLIARAPDLAPALALESEPLVKLLEENAYRELILRARINDAVRAVLLATATGADLDHLGALFGVARFVLDPGDAAALPPVPPLLEGDTAFRARIQLSLEGFSTAGPVGAYIFHALSADPDVLDVGVRSPVPGNVLVTVLSRSGDGTASVPLQIAVSEALNGEDVRPLCDTVIVQGATIVPYQVDAELEFLDGPDRAVVRAAAEAATRAYVDAAHRIGRDVTVSGLHAALHQPGVARATLLSPIGGVTIGPDEAAFCTAITVAEA